MRLLLDPVATDGGSAAPIPAPTPAPVPAPAPAKPAPIQVDPGDYAKTFQELEALRSFKASAEAAQTAALDAAKRLHLEELGKTKGIGEALDAQNKDLKEKQDKIALDYANLQNRYLGEKRDADIMRAIGDKKFASDHARAQVVATLATRFKAEADGDSVKVRDNKTGQFAADVIPGLLDTDEFAHFLAPKSTGGSGASGGSKPAAGTVMEGSMQDFVNKFKAQRAGAFKITG